MKTKSMLYAFFMSATQSLKLNILWEEKQGVWGEHVHSAICKMDNQRGPTV